MSFDIMDTSPDLSFDQLAYLASSICNTPIALISFIDTNRQWFKAAVGLDVQEIPRYVSTCNKTITMNGPNEIKDAADKECEYVKYMKQMGLRYYGGVPITSIEGYNLGTVCVADYVPRELSKDQFETLKIISKQITSLLDIRKKYKLDLDRLKDMNKSIYQHERHYQEIAHKASMHAMAELSTGLIYRLRPFINGIQNACTGPGFPGNSKFINQSAGEISAILDSLEKFISAEKEKSMKPMDISEALEKIILHMSWKFEKFQIDLKVSIEQGLVCIGNASQLKEVFFAVINNAIEAVLHANKKSIEIHLREQDHKVLIDVKDSGVGIQDSIRPFIFQPFFTTKGSRNIGTGLSLAEGILQRHAGDIIILKDFDPTIFQITIPKP